MNKREDIYVLGIETSCDETSASVVKNGREVLSNIISSQIALHQKYGGVVPEIASRKHVEIVMQVVNDAIETAGIAQKDISLIAVTYGPGLVGALLVGLSTAKALAFSLDVPLVGVNHIEGHIAANFIEHPQLEPPFVCLVASGGHSHIVHVNDYDSYEILGQTRDDAAGEAFDKIARALGLGYPGGPLIDEKAKMGNAGAIKFPRVKFSDGSLDYSFSGLKTAVLNYLNRCEQTGESYNVEDVCASFQQAVVDILVENTITAAKQKISGKVTLAGGVAANSALRSHLASVGQKNSIEVFYPRPVLCTDNAAMIACRGYYNYLGGHRSDMTLNAVPNLKIGQKIECCG